MMATPSHGSRDRVQRKPERPYRFGPLRIFIGEDPDRTDYIPVLLSIGHAFTQIFIGSINMTILAYAVHKRDLHSIFCTLGYHFFMAEAILAMNNTNAWSSLFTAEQRTFTHLFMQMCAMIISLTGTVIILMQKGWSTSAHSILGMITTCLSIVAVLLGPLALYTGINMTVFHITFGIPTFIMASVTVGHGVHQKLFKTWAGNYVPWILVALITYITVFIMVMAFIKYVMRIKLSTKDIQPMIRN